MSKQNIPTNSSVDFYEYLQIVPNPDGTFTRKQNKIPNISPTSDPNNPTPVLSKDIPINQSNNTWARIHLPRQALDSSSSSTTNKLKLPLLVYIHGGGFVRWSAATSIIHDFCTNIALKLPAVVLSIDYRLAPEHRLPAAYDDVVEAFHWLKTIHEPWLREYSDYTNCFIMGSSAGGNIAYNAGLRLAGAVHDLQPLKIKGMILHQPFFGGTQRTESELKMANNSRLPLPLTDLMWDLSLPVGVDRDHEYANPTVEGGSKLLDQIKLMGWRVLVTGYYEDSLIDRQIEVFKLMKRNGIKVEAHFKEGGYHGMDEREPVKGESFFLALKNFVMPPIPRAKM